MVMASKHFSQHEFANAHWFILIFNNSYWSVFTYHHFAIRNPVTAFKHNFRKIISPYFNLAQSTFPWKKKKVSLCNTGLELLVVKGYTDTCVQKLFTIFMLIKLNKKIMYIYLLNPLLHTALPSEKTRLSHLLLS